MLQLRDPEHLFARPTKRGHDLPASADSYGQRLKPPLSLQPPLEPQNGQPSTGSPERDGRAQECPPPYTLRSPRLSELVESLCAAVIACGLAMLITLTLLFWQHGWTDPQ